MRSLLNLKVVGLLLVVLAANTYGQEPHVRERARPFEPLIAAAAQRYGVDPHLLWTIAYQETRFQPGLISPKGARGLMQFMPATAVRYSLRNPHDPAQAIDAAARYVSNLSRRFNGNLRLILAAYNSGEGAVEAYRDGRRLILPTGKIINATSLKTGGVPPYRETQGYVLYGTAIYRNTATANIFNGVPRFSRPQTTVEVEPDDDAIEPERSIYINVSDEVNTATKLVSSELPPAVQGSPPTSTPASTRSIYIP